MYSRRPWSHCTKHPRPTECRCKTSAICRHNSCCSRFSSGRSIMQERCIAHGVPSTHNNTMSRHTPPTRVTQHLEQITHQHERIVKVQQCTVECLKDVCARVSIALHQETTETKESHSPDAKRRCDYNTEISELQQELKELRSYVLLLPTIMSREHINVFDLDSKQDETATASSRHKEQLDT
uniref:Uncharacterized protein n=1 Tax=viral metagenome TaxID=1070528 RepID=A0A6C0C185_9ZZZZ